MNRVENLWIKCGEFRRLIQVFIHKSVHLYVESLKNKDQLSSTICIVYKFLNYKHSNVFKTIFQSPTKKISHLQVWHVNKPVQISVPSFDFTPFPADKSSDIC